MKYFFKNFQSNTFLSFCFKMIQHNLITFSNLLINQYYVVSNIIIIKLFFHINIQKTCPTWVLISSSTTRDVYKWATYERVLYLQSDRKIIFFLHYFIIYLFTITCLKMRYREKKIIKDLIKHCSSSLLLSIKNCKSAFHFSVWFIFLLFSPLSTGWSAFLYSRCV